jgi:hypothetical protein
MPRDASPSTAARVVHARSPHADKANTVIVVSYTPYTTPTIAMCSKSTTTTTTTTARRVHGWLNGALHYDHDHDHPTRPRMVKRCPTLRRHRRITASPTDRSTDHEITIDRSIDRPITTGDRPLVCEDVALVRSPQPCQSHPTHRRDAVVRDGTSAHLTPTDERCRPKRSCACLGDNRRGASRDARVASRIERERARDRESAAIVRASGANRRLRIGSRDVRGRDALTARCGVRVNVRLTKCV